MHGHSKSKTKQKGLDLSSFVLLTQDHNSNIHCTNANDKIYRRNDFVGENEKWNY